jgi:ketosteroid isomerase-like protein
MAMAASSPQECVAAFVAAMVARDMDKALALLTDDVALFYSNGTALRGKDAFASAMTASWKLVSGYKYTTVESVWVAQSDTMAAVIYAFAWSGVAAGNEVKGSGRGTRVLRREPTGWCIAHEHLSSGVWK